MPERAVWTEADCRLSLKFRRCGHQDSPQWSRLNKQQTAQGEGRRARNPDVESKVSKERLVTYESSIAYIGWTAWASQTGSRLS